MVLTKEDAYKHKAPSFDQRPKEERIAIARKGGSVSGITKSDGQKMRWLKDKIKKGLIKTDDPQYFLERLENREAMMAHLINYMEEIKDDIPDNQRIQFMNTYNNLARTLHGDKSKVESLNVNVNIDLTDSIREAFKKRHTPVVDVTNSKE
jgi:hypothetical protein